MNRYKFIQNYPRKPIEPEEFYEGLILKKKAESFPSWPKKIRLKEMYLTKNEDPPFYTDNGFGWSFEIIELGYANHHGDKFHSSHLREQYEPV